MTTKTQCKPIYTKLMNSIDPDKVADEHKAEATELTKRANKLYENFDFDGLTNMLNEFINGGYFKGDDGVKTNDPYTLHLNGLNTLKTTGKTRIMGKGYLLMNGIDGKLATKLLDQVWSRGGGGASKGEIIAFIIEGQRNGLNNKQIADAICVQFNFAQSTGTTIISHLSYMVEYAKQVNV